jgi:hypothetical protein
MDERFGPPLASFSFFESVWINVRALLSKIKKVATPKK